MPLPLPASTSGHAVRLNYSFHLRPSVHEYGENQLPYTRDNVMDNMGHMDGQDTVYQKRIPDITDGNLKKDNQLLIVLGTNATGTTVVCWPVVSGISVPKIIKKPSSSYNQ